MMLTAVISLFLIAFLLRRVVAPPERRLPPPDWASRTEAEVALLREEVDRLSREVGRLEEEQSFLLRLVSGDERAALEGGSEPRPRAPETVEGGPSA